MGCLFGYYGSPLPGLLDSMASLLSHRCKKGWERISSQFRHELVVEIGRGIAPWSKPHEPHLGEDAPARTVFGYAGVLFNRHLVMDGAADVRSPNGRLQDGLCRNPDRVLEQADGAFVAALATKDTLHLVRDPAGIKVLYWTLHAGRLVFASEIKALFADPRVDRSMRLSALPEYLTFSYIPGARTMFEGVEELQPGHILKLEHGRVSIERHFRFEDLERDPLSQSNPREHAAFVREALERSVQACCDAVHEPPAVFVSGGIDSSAVLAVAARKVAGERLKTFSVHFGDGYVNENEYVSLMVDRYRTDHTWLEIKPSRFLDRMQEIFWYLDDPIGDPITTPNFLMAEAASRETGLVLNGEGGDPCFGGPKNIPMLLAKIYGPGPGEASTPWLEREYLLSYRKCFSDLDKLLLPDVFRETGGEEHLISIVEPFFRAASPKSFLNKLMAANIRLKGANLILVKVDKMTSANGVLALPPLFTRSMIEASMRCAPWFKLEGNTEKSVLKQAVADIVPQPIVERPKSGMMVPVRFWFRGEMYRYAERLLSKKTLQRTGFFNTDYVRQLLSYDVTDTSGIRQGTKLWMLITFMLWYDRMIESPRVEAPARSAGLLSRLFR
jgi:asparagine synthase (glutamine-hydrolysing)